MRVGVVTTSFPRWPDDPAGSFVAGHVGWLTRAGHQVEVVCAGADPGPGPQPAHLPWQPGVRIHPVAAPPGLFYAGGAPESLAADSRALTAAARFAAALSATVARLARGWDLAFAHWLVPGGAALATTAPRLPVVAIAHSGDVHLVRRLGLAMPLAATLARPRLRLAFVSRHGRDHFLGGVWPTRLRQHLQARSLITPMGIDVARFRTAAGARAADIREADIRAADTRAAGAPAAEARAAGAPAAGPRAAGHTVLFLGRLVPVKGAHVLLEALAHLPAHCGPVHLVIAGDGPERLALEAQAAAARGRGPASLVVDFPGEVRGPERDRLLARADLLVLPSVPVEARRTEGLPVTALEAMAAGVPVLASRTGGLAELPDEVVTLVPPGDPVALARALARCLGEPALRQSRARAAARWVEQHDWARVGARLWAHAGPVQPRTRPSVILPTS